MFSLGDGIHVFVLLPLNGAIHILKVFLPVKRDFTKSVFVYLSCLFSDTIKSTIEPLISPVSFALLTYSFIGCISMQEHLLLFYITGAFTLVTLVVLWCQLLISRQTHTILNHFEGLQTFTLKGIDVSQITACFDFLWQVSASMSYRGSSNIG